MHPSDSLKFRAGIALGSNLGDRLSHLRQAAEALRQLSSSPESVRSSRIYQTAPVDCPPNSPPFLNAAMEIEWMGEPEALWGELQRLEAAAGRPPTHSLHAPRPLDLDFLYLGSRFVSSGPVLLPHPRMGVRRFVLTPLADYIPHRILPGEKKTVQERLAELPPFPSVERVEQVLFMDN